MRARNVMFVVLGVTGVIGVAAAAGYGWASSAARSRLEQRFEAHDIDIPVPWPGAEAAGTDGTPDALAAAIERGRHLVEARYACTECHGVDLGGGVMVDDPAIGSLHGPNLTRGRGSAVADYTMTDWDHIVRHGIKPDGTPAVMPSEDFVRMSDQELSDIVAFIAARPPVDAETPPVVFGPVGQVLLATGQFPLSAERVADHHALHRAEPPPAGPTVAFGEHLAAVCTGCHGADFSGGPIAAGPPDWPPAANLTPHADGLAGWSQDEFIRALREGVTPDGRRLQPPMDSVSALARNMTDVELEAIWRYLETLPPVPGG